LAGFVSCNHNNIIPDGRTILGATLKLRGSRIFGRSPLRDGNWIQLDMVRLDRRRCVGFTPAAV
jgi:hypothetical protein